MRQSVFVAYFVPKGIRRQNKRQTALSPKSLSPKKNCRLISRLTLITGHKKIDYLSLLLNNNSNYYYYLTITTNIQFF